MELTKQSSKSTKRKLTVKGNKSESQPNKESKNSHVAVSAYYKAKARGFEPGYEFEDWLVAEAEENQ